MTAPAPSPSNPNTPAGVSDRVKLTLQYLRMQRNPERASNRVDLLINGEQYFPALLRAIQAAQREVRIETYIFADDPVGQSLCKALVEASLRGVRVRLVLDGFGGKEGLARWVPSLRSAGVWVRVFRPERWAFNPSPLRLRRMHRKIAVIDRRVAFVGGINLIDDYNLTAEREALQLQVKRAHHWGGVAHSDPGEHLLDNTLGPRFDCAVRLEGPVVQDVWNANEWLWWQIGPGGRVAESLNTRWWRNRFRQLNQVLADEALNEPPPAAGVARVKLLLRDNLRFRSRIERAYLTAMGQATQSIVIANAYFIPSRRFRLALKHASQRGVKVSLLLQGLVEYRFQHFATQALYDELLDCGIDIYEYQHSFLHAKVAVVDQSWATVGSSNIDPFSLLLAREANVVVRCSQFAGQLRHVLLNAIQQHSRPVLEQAHAMRPVSHKLRSWLYYGALRLAVLLGALRGRY